MLEAGDKIPDLAAPDQRGERRSLSHLSDGWLVIFFYPKDFTSG